MINFTAIIIPAIVVGCVGLLIAIFLGIAGEKFKVPVDEREGGGYAHDGRVARKGTARC